MFNKTVNYWVSPQRAGSMHMSLPGSGSLTRVDFEDLIHHTVVNNLKSDFMRRFFVLMSFSLFVTGLNHLLMTNSG